MAEIKVERKRTSVWAWILGLIAVALLIWLATELFRGEEAAVEPAAEQVGGGTRSAPAPLASLRAA